MCLLFLQHIHVYGNSITNFIKYSVYGFTVNIIIPLLHRKGYTVLTLSVLPSVCPSVPQALVSFKKYMPPPLPYFKVNICPFPLPHFASIFFVYLWSFRWPNYIVTLPRYFCFRLPHLNIFTGPTSDELDKNIQRT